MLYVATNRVSWLVIGFTLFVPAVAIAVHSFSHVQTRFNIWLNALDPEVYERGSYQLVQGLFGQASGGLMGTGWGRGYRSSCRWRTRTSSCPPSRRNWA